MVQPKPLAEIIAITEKLARNSPRYAQARQQTGSVQGWATGLQEAGYATDPDYAAKLSRAINTTLQLQRAQS